MAEFHDVDFLRLDELLTDEERLARKAVRAAAQTGIPRILVGGGVARNARLRARLGEHADREGLEVHFAPPAFCTDNAVMIAGLGHAHLEAGRVADLAADVAARGPCTPPALPRGPACPWAWGAAAARSRPACVSPRPSAPASRSGRPSPPSPPFRPGRSASPTSSVGSGPATGRTSCISPPIRGRRAVTSGTSSWKRSPMLGTRTRLGLRHRLGLSSAKPTNRTSPVQHPCSSVKPHRKRCAMP